MTFNIGDQVRILPPFSAAFPDTYTVLGPAQSQAADTYSVDVRKDGVGGDFHQDYLQAV